MSLLAEQFLPLFVFLRQAALRLTMHARMYSRHALSLSLSLSEAWRARQEETPWEKARKPQAAHARGKCVVNCHADRSTLLELCAFLHVGERLACRPSPPYNPIIAHSFVFVFPTDRV